MTESQNNPKPNNNGDSNYKKEKPLLGIDGLNSSNIYQDLDKMGDKSYALTDKEDNNSKSKSTKITLNLNDKKAKPFLIEKKKDECIPKSSKGIGLEESDEVNNDLSDNKKNKISYSIGESNKQRKKRNKNKILNEDENESTKITQKNTKFVEGNNNSKNLNDLKKNIDNIKDFKSNKKIIQLLNDYINNKIQNEIFDKPLDILSESEIKKIFEEIFLKYKQSLFKFASLRAEKMYGYELKNNKNNFSINIDKPEEILKKKNIDLFAGSAREELDFLIKNEKENNKITNKKILVLLFNENCKKRFLDYLNDVTYIEDDNLTMELQGFETFDKHFETYSKEKKNDLKKCIYLFLNIEYPEKLWDKDITKTKQTTRNYSDSKKSITNKAIEDSFHTVLYNFALEKYNIKLYNPTLSCVIEYNTDEYYNFFDENAIYIYSDIKPKKHIEGKNYKLPLYEVLTFEKILEKENSKFDLLLNHEKIIIILKGFIFDKKSYYI